jgi:hypothetical protein
VLANGDEIAADLVVSSVDPNLTFLKFVDARELLGERRLQLGRQVDLAAIVILRHPWIERQSPLL